MAEDLTGRTLLGKYRIVELLGQGGMGTVWRATHVRTGRKLAIKVLDERFLSNGSIVQRFGREARAASAIQHPGIVEVLDLDQTEEGVPFLVMELLEGETLATRIERVGRLSQDEAVQVMTQLLGALDAAHARGVVHRDLKPDNVVLVPRGQGAGESLKILDFGISQKEDERVAQLTLAGSVLGTPHYMAPEQALGEATVDARADVYAAAVVMYECVVGDVPFDAPNYNRLIQVILNEEPIPPRERGAAVDPGVEEVIVRAMAKDRAERPETAGAMLEMLEAVTSEATMPFDRETLGFVREGRPPSGAASREGLAETLAEHAPREAPSGAEIDLPELDLSPPPRAKPPPASPSHPPSAAPLAGTSPLDDLLAPAQDGAALELDEAALVRSTRPPRPRSSVPPAEPEPGRVSSPGRISSPGRASTPGPHRRTPSYGRLSAAPAAAPTADRRQAKLPRVLLYVVGTLAVFAALVLGLRAIVRPSEPREVEAPPPVAVEPDEESGPAIETVSLDVGGLPAGARVKVDGLPAGSLPVRVRRGTRHRIEIVAPGYEPRSMEVEADSDVRVRADLRPVSP